MIKLSVFSDEAGDTLAEQIRALKENNLRYTDIRHVDKVNVLNFTYDQAKEYQNALAAEGLGVSCIGSPLGKQEPCTFADFKANLDKMLDFCEIFECDKIRGFSFYSFEGKEDMIIDCLKEAAAYSKSRGVTLYHENELGIYGDAPSVCREIIEKTGCGCIFDPANFVLAGHRIEEAEELLLPLSDFYHIKDGRYSMQIVPAGHGDGNLRSLLTRDNITMTIEPHLATFDGLANLTSHGFKPSEFVYDSTRAAFDAGVAAVKSILDENGIAYQ